MLSKTRHPAYERRWKILAVLALSLVNGDPERVPVRVGEAAHPRPEAQRIGRKGEHSGVPLRRPDPRDRRPSPLDEVAPGPGDPGGELLGAAHARAAPASARRGRASRAPW